MVKKSLFSALILPLMAIAKETLRAYLFRFPLRRVIHHPPLFLKKESLNMIRPRIVLTCEQVHAC